MFCVGKIKKSTVHVGFQIKQIVVNFGIALYVDLRSSQKRKSSQAAFVAQNLATI